MKHLKTILAEATGMSAEYDFFAEAERVGDISLRIYFRACCAGDDGLSRDEAAECLRQRYQSTGLAHLCPV